MSKNVLVIMAAGLGSRYGGIKQLEPVGPSGEIILNYSVYDAMAAGFGKVVFIIRKDIEKDFKEVIGDRLSESIEVEYVFQDIDNLPVGYKKPEARTKPWGTGQAVLSCLGALDAPFAVINADDYYGKESFIKIHDFLNHPGTCEKQYHFCMAGFKVGNTLSENGSVTRGVCQVSDAGILEDIVETSGIEQKGNVAITEDPNKTISLDCPVSMNMWGFTPDFLKELDVRFADFLDHIEGNELKAEYLLPSIVGDLIQEGKAEVSVLNTEDKWFGVTYKEDKEFVVKSFQTLIDQGLYPNKL